MHTLKKLLLVTCCASTVTVCTENQPHIASTLPAESAAAEMSNGQIRAGFQILNRNYHEIAEGLKQTNAQNEQFHKEILTALKKATKTGWPFSARLIVLGLSSFIAWEHKDALKAAVTKENATTAWNQKEEIFNTVKESALTGYLKVKTIMQKAAQQTMQGQNPDATQQVITPETPSQDTQSATPVVVEEGMRMQSELDNPNNQRED